MQHRPQGQTHPHARTTTAGSRPDAQPAGQHPGESPYHHTKAARSPKFGVYGFLGLVVTLFALCMFLLVQWNSTRTELGRTIKENNSLREDVERLNSYNRRLGELQNSAGQSAAMLKSGANAAVGSVAVDTSNATPEYWKNRATQLEKELIRAEKDIAHYKSFLPAETVAEMKKLAELAVEDVKVLPTAGGSEVTFAVTNKAKITAKRLTGAIRFWRDDKVVYELPFRVDELPGQSRQEFKLQLPELDYSHYTGFIHSGGSQ